MSSGPRCRSSHKVCRVNAIADTRIRPRELSKGVDADMLKDGAKVEPPVIKQ